MTRTNSTRESSQPTHVLPHFVDLDIHKQAKPKRLHEMEDRALLAIQEPEP
jgi:hypothetical protein